MKMRKDPLKEAVRYLSARSRSEAEVKAYLARRGHDSESAGAAVEALRSERLLGDEAAAVRWA
ncbi:MAG TPA: recombination regulator RecX, partial [Bacillota bacterium]|nr:recombination regulator RecX [Bacillota bacterium]